MLNKIQYDILKELINIGIGEAGASLATMMQSRVTLQIPEVEILASNEVSGYLKEQIPDLGIHIAQNFKGDVNGKALLCYSEKASRSLLEGLTQEKIQTLNLSDQHKSILEEIGNILLGSCITVIANTIEEVFSFELPYVGHDSHADYFSSLLAELLEFDSAMIVKTEMKIKDSDINGYIFILMGFQDIVSILQRLEAKMKL